MGFEASCRGLQVAPTTTTATPTPTAATTAATEAPTPATTPTTATASSTSTASTASTTTTPAATATTPATLALAAVALRTKSRSSPDNLSTKDVNSSSRSVGGGKGGGETPLKEGCARSATSSTYSDYASLSCKEQITPARELNSIKKLSTPGVIQETEAALRSVWQPTRLLTTTAGVKNVTRLLLALATTKASTLCGCTSTSTTAAATSATAAAASTTAAAASTTSTATTEAPTPGTTPTSTATPSTSSTASTAAPAAPSTTLAPLALAVAAPPTRGRHSSDLLSANVVDSSSRSNRGEKGDRGTPLKERGATVAARSTDS
ncbi:unnamed protein product [Closterium sp. NIES-53]